MNLKNIEKIELNYLEIDDYKEVARLMEDEYRHLKDSTWSKEELAILINKFPKGQVSIKIDGEFAGFALSLIVDYDKFEDNHTYKQITGNYTFNTFNPLGNILYGVDVFVNKKYRGLRLGRRLYDYRKSFAKS